jgi:DNA-binding protein
LPCAFTLITTDHEAVVNKSLIVKAKEKRPTKAEVFAELIRKVLHKDVELEEIGVGVQGENKQKPGEEKGAGRSH